MEEFPPSRQDSVRVMLLDDHPVVRCGFERRLRREPDLDIAGAFASSRELMAALRRGACDVVVLDYLLLIDDIDGALLIRHLRILHPTVRILVSTSYVNAPTISACLRAGATGFFCKSEKLDELVYAIRTVARGNEYLGREARGALGRASAEGGIASPLGEAGLTLKELEVVRCCLHGMSVTLIARKFRRSVKTVSGHKVAAYRKLGI
ncbi:MAG: response regulator, partial [Janthinobacterium lividum]